MTTAIRERTCPLCGLEANSPHHIIPRAEGGVEEAGNLVYLCSKCHNGIEPQWNLFVNFLKHYANKKKGKVPAKWKEPKPVVVKFKGKGEITKTWTSRPVYNPPEGSPNWLARELGVHRCTVSSIVHKNWPRPQSEKWKLRRLNQEQIDLITEVINEKKKWHEEADLERSSREVGQRVGIKHSGRGPGRYGSGEVSPDNFGYEIGISGKAVRSALRKLFPRNEITKWNRWGPLTLQMQSAIRDLVLEYNNSGEKSWSKFLNNLELTISSNLTNGDIA